jgi:hypothetical protein
MRNIYRHGAYLCLLATSMSILSGCATILNGGSEDIPISSVPSEATVKILDKNNQVFWSGVTPATVSMKRGAGFFQGASYQIEISKKGFATQTVTISSDLNGGWYILGNLIFGGVIGWLIVDPLSGAMWTLSPDRVNANLQEQASWLRDKHGLVIVLRQQIPNNLFQELSPLRIR